MDEATELYHAYQDSFTPTPGPVMSEEEKRMKDALGRLLRETVEELDFLDTLTAELLVTALTDELHDKHVRVRSFTARKANTDGTPGEPMEVPEQGRYFDAGLYWFKVDTTNGNQQVPFQIPRPGYYNIVGTRIGPFLSTY